MNSTGNSAENKPVIPVLTGPTASGKTSVVLRLLEEYPEIDIISADSRQIYRHLAIGTDKPSPEILEKYNFHLVDFVEPGDRYTAFDFVDDSRRIIGKSLEKGQVPLICGGTGLYIKSLVEGIVEIPEDDLSFRKELEESATAKGPKYLYEKLQKIDPKEASKTHPNNIKRIIRALEIFLITGRTKSDILYKNPENSDVYEYDIICLMPPREELYRKINDRVDLMIKSGLLNEIDKLYKRDLK